VSVRWHGGINRLELGNVVQGLTQQFGADAVAPAFADQSAILRGNESLFV
jgi:hypothetical protein